MKFKETIKKIRIWISAFFIKAKKFIPFALNMLKKCRIVVCNYVASIIAAARKQIGELSIQTMKYIAFLLFGLKRCGTVIKTCQENPDASVGDELAKNL